MIDKKVNADEQVQRMKNLMNYGLKENKQQAYSSVEYSKKAADGKLYGIVREGAKYYIKVAANPNGKLVAENFDYIGGFRNRKDNMFESFASAERYFCEKMQCINESVDDIQKRVIAESWDLEAKKEVIEEGTKKMQAEIARQRQIMKNAQSINEGKSCDMIGGCPKTDTIKTEEPSSEPGAPFTQKLTNADLKDSEKSNIKGKAKPMVGNKKATNESTETPLASRKNPDYMDTTHGTEIGNSAPYVDSVDGGQEDAVANAKGGEEEKPEMESVNEETVMHDSDNQNKPAPGVGDKGSNELYEEKAEITEDVEDLSDEIEDDEMEDDFGLDNEEGTSVDADAEGEELVNGEDGDEEETVEDETEIEEPASDTEARLDAMEEKLNQILDALNNLKYEDEPLYGEDEEDEDDLDNSEEDGPVEPEEEIEDEVEVVESKSYKAMMSKKKINEEDDFGKHPAFQKVVMSTPATNMPDGEGQYDMNDDSVENDKPYATSKGSQAPYEKAPDAIEDAITEAVMKILKKKLV